MKKTVLIVGCGDIALRTVRLLRTHYRLFGLFRNPEKAEPFRLLGVMPVIGDLDQPDSLGRIAGIAQIVIHLAPPPHRGTRDTRTANLLSALSRQTKSKHMILPQRFIYISTSGVYGDCQGALIDETRPLNPLSDRAMRRKNAETQIRKWSIRNHVPVSILRVPGIYAESRLPLKRIRESLPAFVDKDDGYTNHIHADDLAHIICATIHRARPGRTYNTTDDTEMKMGDYFDLVADRFGLPRPPRIPRDQANGRISPAMLSFMNESRRISNSRMKKELRIKLQYPTVIEGIQGALSSIAK
ncbi:Nucleoside-diphosphate-sugar epimerase [Nitrosomonas marina]|uniref:Nucleoside-diphosphate-sugar epimerase n=1 Tax=Nitrosomonas marina TaxID=917 RepID=A0A1I0CCG3_9PROT|nr:SDR family oxidoreductase [Nitrosomonas marina]SET17248.1 Nucleoside-diphosphate-sugar epimerase [Nitrosomonas marina]